jgi:hypothetical protein
MKYFANTAKVAIKEVKPANDLDPGGKLSQVPSHRKEL